jgi:CRISPR-associated DxTHG motif protein
LLHDALAAVSRKIYALLLLCCFFYFFNFLILSAIDVTHSFNQQPTFAVAVDSCQWASLERVAAHPNTLSYPWDASFKLQAQCIGFELCMKKLGHDIRKRATAASLFNATIVVISSFSR